MNEKVILVLWANVASRKLTGFVVCLSVGILIGELLCAVSATGQEKNISNPVAGNLSAIREGASLFRANCSPCHGLDAKGGVQGPDLSTNRWAHGSSDAGYLSDDHAGSSRHCDARQRFRGLRSLVPRSLPSLLKLPQRKPFQVTAREARRIFFGSGGCSQCHMVNGHGGRLGPDLSRAGASRSLAYLIDSIRDPSKELSVGLGDPNNPWGLLWFMTPSPWSSPMGSEALGWLRMRILFQSNCSTQTRTCNSS